jgi:hypothetical protein
LISDLQQYRVAFWSGPIGNYIFIPLNEESKFFYRNKDIELSDSINNIIVYADTVFDDSVIVYNAENLISGKIKSFSIPINENNGVYPYYEEMKLFQNNITIRTHIGNYNINIGDLYY